MFPLKITVLVAITTPPFVAKVKVAVPAVPSLRIVSDSPAEADPSPFCFTFITTDFARVVPLSETYPGPTNETVTESVERSVKQAQRETENEMRQARKDVREDLDKARNEVNAIRKEMADARREISREVEQLKKEVDGKIQKAIDNPLANK